MTLSLLMSPLAISLSGMQNNLDLSRPHGVECCLMVQQQVVKHANDMLTGTGLASIRRTSFRGQCAQLIGVDTL